MPGQINAPRFNLKMLASLLFYTVVEYLEQLLGSKGYAEDLFNSGLRTVVFKTQDIRLFFSAENFKARSDKFVLIETFMKRLNDAVLRASARF